MKTTLIYIFLSILMSIAYVSCSTDDSEVLLNAFYGHWNVTSFCNRADSNYFYRLDGVFLSNTGDELGNFASLPPYEAATFEEYMSIRDVKDYWFVKLKNKNIEIRFESTNPKINGVWSVVNINTDPYSYDPNAVVMFKLERDKNECLLFKRTLLSLPGKN